MDQNIKFTESGIDPVIGNFSPEDLHTCSEAEAHAFVEVDKVAEYVVDVTSSAAPKSKRAPAKRKAAQS